MFHAHNLKMIAEFFLMFHKDKPIDWLLDHILWVKVCESGKRRGEQPISTTPVMPNKDILKSRNNIDNM